MLVRIKESRELRRVGLINDKKGVTTYDEPVDIDVDSEEEIDIETTPDEDKSRIL